MGQLNKKQIKAQVINEVRKQYDEKLAAHHKVNERLSKELCRVNHLREELQSQVRSLKDELEQQKQQVAILQEWNDRLLSYMDLPEDERNEKFAQFNESLKSMKKQEHMLDNIERMTYFFSRVFM